MPAMPTDEWHQIRMQRTIAAADRAEAARISAATEAQQAEIRRDPHVGINPFAIAALICAVIVPPLGLILGVIALVQINKSDEGGRGLAIAAITIPIVLVLLFVVLPGIISFL